MSFEIISNQSPHHNDPYLDTHLEADDHSYLSVVANRILLRKWYTVLYVFVFVTQTFLFIWGLVNHNFFKELGREDIWYICLDVVVTILLMVEVAVRVLAYKGYWRRWYNILDFVIMVFCVGALSLYFVDPESAVIGSLVLAFRYFFQLIRVFLMLKHHRDRKYMVAAANHDVDFSPFTAADEEDLENPFSIDDRGLQHPPT